MKDLVVSRSRVPPGKPQMTRIPMLLMRLWCSKDWHWVTLRMIGRIERTNQWAIAPRRTRESPVDPMHLAVDHVRLMRRLKLTRSFWSMVSLVSPRTSMPLWRLLISSIHVALMLLARCWTIPSHAPRLLLLINRNRWVGRPHLIDRRLRCVAVA